MHLNFFSALSQEHLIHGPTLEIGYAKILRNGLIILQNTINTRIKLATYITNCSFNCARAVVLQDLQPII